MRHCLISYVVLLAALGAPSTSNAADIALAQRTSAAQATALNARECVSIQPFYWEIGDAGRALAGDPVGQDAPARDTRMMIASASKWIYSGYVAERRQGNLTDEDIRFLTFRSGYTRFRICRSTQTVSSCMDSLINGFGAQDSATMNRFDYNGGHMQKHAALMGLGAMDNDALGAEIRNGLGRLGPGWDFRYKQPQLAGGGISSVADYSRFLRAVMAEDLQIGKWLGKNAVCTNSQTCPNEAIKTPIPRNETWHYSIGHWVEDDPQVGDGAYSSPGAFGFYPWISRDKAYYGIVAREDHQGVMLANQSEKPGVQSVGCGRLIRAAWMDGQARH